MDLARDEDGEKGHPSEDGNNGHHVIRGGWAGGGGVGGGSGWVAEGGLKLP